MKFNVIDVDVTNVPVLMLLVCKDAQEVLTRANLPDSDIDDLYAEITILQGKALQFHNLVHEVGANHKHPQYSPAFQIIMEVKEYLEYIEDTTTLLFDLRRLMRLFEEMED